MGLAGEWLKWQGADFRLQRAGETMTDDGLREKGKILGFTYSEGGG